MPENKRLEFEIKCLEELIASPTAPEKEKRFARKLLPSYKRLARKGCNANSVVVEPD